MTKLHPSMADTAATGADKMIQKMKKAFVISEPASNPLTTFRYPGVLTGRVSGCDIPDEKRLPNLLNREGASRL